MRELWPLIPFFLLLGGLILALITWERKAARTWTMVAEGAYDSVEHKQRHYTTRSGSMVHTTHHHVQRTTIVRFRDGATVACNGHFHPEWPAGTMIRILRNGLSASKIEKVEQ